MSSKGNMVIEWTLQRKKTTHEGIAAISPSGHNFRHGTSTLCSVEATVMHRSLLVESALPPHSTTGHGSGHPPRTGLREPDPITGTPFPGGLGCCRYHLVSRHHRSFAEFEGVVVVVVVAALKVARALEVPDPGTPALDPRTRKLRVTTAEMYKLAQFQYEGMMMGRCEEEGWA